MLASKPAHGCDGDAAQMVKDAQSGELQPVIHYATAPTVGSLVHGLLKGVRNLDR